MVRRARRFDPRLLAAGLLVGSCVSSPEVDVRDPPPKPPDPVALAAPLPFRVGLTRGETDPLTEALVRRLRRTNLFTEVYFPLESGAEMDAAIEFEVRRGLVYDSKTRDDIFAALTFGMSSSTQTRDFTSTVDAGLSLRVGERTLRRIEKTIHVSVVVEPKTTSSALWKAVDESAAELVASQFVEELSKEPEKLAADIAAGPTGAAP